MSPVKLTLQWWRHEHIHRNAHTRVVVSVLAKVEQVQGRERRVRWQGGLSQSAAGAERWTKLSEVLYIGLFGL